MTSEIEDKLKELASNLMINNIKIPIATYLASNSVSEISIALFNINPMDITEISRLSEELTQTSFYTSQINDALKTVYKQLDDEFRKASNKRGISESDWKEYGCIQYKNGVNKCFYKSEEMF